MRSNFVMVPFASRCISVSMSGRAGKHPRHCPAAVRSMVYTDQIFFFHTEIHVSDLQFFCLFPWRRLLALLLFRGIQLCPDGWLFRFGCAGLLGFRCLFFVLNCGARSVREICSPTFALASNSPREGALFSTPSIMFSFCSVESSAVRRGFSRKNSGTCWKPTLSQ